MSSTPAEAHPSFIGMRPAPVRKTAAVWRRCIADGMTGERRGASAGEWPAEAPTRLGRRSLVRRWHAACSSNRRHAATAIVLNGRRAHPGPHRVDGGSRRARGCLQSLAYALRTPLGVVSGAVSKLGSDLAGHMSDDDRLLVTLAERSLQRLGRIADTVSLAAASSSKRAGCLQAARGRRAHGS
jgi:hypothetical protein